MIYLFLKLPTREIYFLFMPQVLINTVIIDKTYDSGLFIYLISLKEN